jgi:hypothetical protein
MSALSFVLSHRMDATFPFILDVLLRYVQQVLRSHIHSLVELLAGVDSIAAQLLLDAQNLVELR